MERDSLEAISLEAIELERAGKAPSPELIDRLMRYRHEQDVTMIDELLRSLMKLKTQLPYRVELYTIEQDALLRRTIRMLVEVAVSLRDNATLIRDVRGEGHDDDSTT